MECSIFDECGREIHCENSRSACDSEYAVPSGLLDAYYAKYFCDPDNTRNGSAKRETVLEGACSG